MLDDCSGLGDATPEYRIDGRQQAAPRFLWWACGQGRQLSLPLRGPTRVGYPTSAIAAACYRIHEPHALHPSRLPALEVGRPCTAFSMPLGAPAIRVPRILDGYGRGPLCIKCGKWPQSD
jgi:hypothetical protein